MSEASRRPIQSRSSWWARNSAFWLATHGVTPNHISLLSILFAAAGAFLLWKYSGSPYWFLLGCAACIQARLICNLLDGMVAVEGGKKTVLGPLFNEFPDRIADSFLFIALGYAIELAWLGWLAALMAALTAYVRVFGGSLGLHQSFRGPMAKQHRMAVLTIACILECIEHWNFGTRWTLETVAWVIVIGSAVTCATRTHGIVGQLQRANSIHASTS